MARVGAELQTPCRGTDARRIPRRHLERDIGGGARHFRVAATHDSGKALCALRIGHDDLTGFQYALLAVERDEFFSLGGLAHNDRRAREFLKIEHVAGVAELEVDEVRDIDHVVDGALPDRLKRLHQPRGARPDLDAPDHAEREHRAGLGDAVLQFDRGGDIVIRWCGFGLFLAAGAGGFQDAPGLCRGFAGEADEAECIAPVGGDGNVEAGVAPGKFLARFDLEAGVDEGVFDLSGGQIARFEVGIQPVGGDVHGAKGRKSEAVIAQRSSRPISSRCVKRCTRRRYRSRNHQQPGCGVR